MDLDTYQKNLVGLLVVCGSLLAARGSQGSHGSQGTAAKGKQACTKRASQWAFYVVYSLVMAADWLQGPYIYSLYKDEHQVPPELISTLFTTGFLSGAVSGYFTGTFADRSGRRFACLSFCVIYSTSCLLTIAGSNLPMLFAGRLLGGVATSLLFSVFDSWMVTDFHSRFLDKKGLDLSKTFGTMSTLNSIMAILSGVSSEWLVKSQGTRKAPFAVSIGLLGLAWLFIYGQWDENYGEPVSKSKKDRGSESKLFKTLSNSKVLSLGLASTMFEGSMYLFVFFWTPALRDAQTDTDKGLPYGTIFASFMASMMASSLIFNHVMARQLLGYGQLLVGLLGTSTAVFYALSTRRTEQMTFWLFCAFEACVGMYWPCTGYLKGKVIDDGVRAQVYSMLRIPLNMFVVVSLVLTGDGSEYGSVFFVCSLFLLGSSAALTATMLGPSSP